MHIITENEKCASTHIQSCFILIHFHFFFFYFIKMILGRKYSIIHAIILAQRAGSQTIGSNTHADTAGFDWIETFPRGPALASRV